MKKVLKSRVFIFIATAILFTGIGVCGATIYPYEANEISYTPSNGETIDVNKALNELYNNMNCNSSSDVDIATSFSLEQSLTFDYTNVKLNQVVMELNSISFSNSTGKLIFSKSIDENGILSITRNEISGVSATGTLYISSDIQFFKSATSTNYTVSVDCKNIENYQELTENNFLIDMRSFSLNSISGSTTFTKEYNATTGTLTYSRGALSGNSVASFNVDVYVKK